MGTVEHCESSVFSKNHVYVKYKIVNLKKFIDLPEDLTLRIKFASDQWKQIEVQNSIS